MAGPLSEPEKKRIVDLYEHRLSQFGRDVRTVGWGSRETQQLRFEVLCRDLDLSGKRILDVGCGLGDLVPFLDRAGHKDYDYVGIDIAPRLIEEASRQFGSNNRTFVVGDLLEMQNLGTFDVVILSGALTLRVTDNIGLAQRTISKMFEISRHAVAVNFLSKYVDYETEKDFHFQPESMFTYAMSLTRWVTLYHNYPLYEFTLQLLRNPIGGVPPVTASV